MKKNIFLCFIVFFMLCKPAFAGNQNASLFVNGRLADVKSRPEIMNGNSFVPVRFIAEKMGYKVGWNEKNRVVSIDKDEKKIELTLFKEFAKVNGVETRIHAAPYIKNGSTMIPLRFIAENLGEKIEWDGKNKIILVGEFKTGVHKDESLKYTAHELGFSIEIPNDLKNSIILEEKGNFLVAYEKKSYETANKETKGILFTIGKTKDVPIAKLISGIILEKNGDEYFEAILPSDTQFQAETKDVYMAVYDRLDEIFNSFKSIN